MKVALDATPLSVTTGGVRRYTEELVRALGVEYPADSFHLLSDQRFHVTDQLPANVKIHPRGLSRRWWLVGLSRELSRLDCDVFHGTDFSVPYLRLRPTVMTLHDLSPWRDRGWHHAADRVRRRTPFLLRLGIATMVITPTEAVRREAIAMFRLAESRIVAVPEAASDLFRPMPGGDGGKPYFLYLGTLEPRKNVGLLLDAWREVRKTHDVDLVLAGRQREDFSPLPDEPGLRVTGAVSDAELPALYSNAVASLYPSLYEGFGLPVLEAMQCGCPVITSRDPAIMEVSAGAAVHEEASDVRGWAAAMERVLLSPDDWRLKGIRRAADFSWIATARLTMEVYAEAIRRFNR